MATEKRLKGYDPITLESFTRHITKHREPYDQYDMGYVDAVEQIENFLEYNTVDTVEVIRCEDCKHNHRVINHITHNEQCFCTASRVYYPEVMPEHFCGYGERKNNHES
jgi:hypothetical protein